MEKNEIKKLLYKQNTEARLYRVNKSGIMYKALLDIDEGFERLTFIIPLEDMGDATFEEIEKAKLLIRWLQ